MVASLTPQPTEYRSLLQEYGAAAADVRKAHTAYTKAAKGAEHAERSYREAEAALFLTDEAACGYVAHGKNETDRKDRRTLLLAGKATIHKVDVEPDGDNGFRDITITLTHPGLVAQRTAWDAAEDAKAAAVVELEYARHLLTMARFALVGYLDTAVDRVNEEAEEGMPF